MRSKFFHEPCVHEIVYMLYNARYQHYNTELQPLIILQTLPRPGDSRGFTNGINEPDPPRYKYAELALLFSPLSQTTLTVSDSTVSLEIILALYQVA
ncbi:hypothetical protein J6590_005249 [Homalodisca vitripennis]|nr:hypothetical protein J6590_005249 [Homalodisca vitripennis]